MALTLSYTDLITPSQVADLAMGKLGDQVETAMRADAGSGDTEEIQQTALRQIKAATKKVEAFLSRKLIIREATMRWRNDKHGSDWQEASEFTRPNQSPRYTAYFDTFPVVEVYQVDGSVALAPEITIVGDRKDYGVVHFDDDLSNLPTDAVYFAGFIRDDQEAPGSGETWNSALGTGALTNLTTAAQVDEIPQDIVEVAGNIVIASLTWHLKGLIGISEATVSADRMQITSKKALDNYVSKQLKSIYHHRLVPAF